MLTIEKVREVVEPLGWRVEEEQSSGDWMFEAWSPAGEDVFYYARPDHAYDDLRSEYNNYDVDEHVDLWAGSRGKNGCPCSYRALIEDAEAIEEMLKDLYEAVGQAENDAEYDED